MPAPKALTNARTLGGVIGLVALLGGCGQGGPGDLQDASALSMPAASEYVIGSDDELTLHFTYNANFDQTETVQQDGRIALPMIGQIAAAGMTPQQLAGRLSDGYAAILQHPEVVVMVKNAASQRVFVTGEVGRSGVVPLSPDMTITSAITAAGGLKDTAGGSHVVVFRRDPAGVEHAYRINVDSILGGNNMTQNVRLAPRDIVFVPKSTLATANMYVKQVLHDNIPFGVAIPF